MKAHVILLVSNDPEVTCLVEDEVLGERHGFRHIADHGAARRALSDGGEDVDLVILDLDPDIGGLNLFSHARPHLPVLVLTSYTVADLAKVFRHRVANGCLAKPFTKAQLHEAIHALLTPKVAAVEAR